MTIDIDKFIEAFASSAILLIALLVVAQILAPEFVPFLFGLIPDVIGFGARFLVVVILVVIALEILDL